VTFFINLKKADKKGVFFKRTKLQLNRKIEVYTKSFYRQQYKILDFLSLYTSQMSIFEFSVSMDLFNEGMLVAKGSLNLLVSIYDTFLDC